MYDYRTVTPTKVISQPDYFAFLNHLSALLAGAGITLPSNSRGERASGRVYLNAPGDSSPRIRRVLDFVEVRIGDTFRLDDLAEVAELSRYHFSRVFREETGQTPWAYVREMRVQRAKELLREGWSLAAAAQEAGFFDQSHLTRAFRTIDGRTPGEYCRSLISPEEDTDNECTDRKNVQDG